MPFPLFLLGLVGLAPFVGCGLAALGAHSGGDDLWLAALIGYAAVVLGFFGGVHWGLVLREPAPSRSTMRVGLAVVPLALSWAALVAEATGLSWVALLILIGGYILAIAAEHRGSQEGLLPNRYLWLRWTFTIVAVAMLTTVVTLRLLGQTIVF